MKRIYQWATAVSLGLALSTAAQARTSCIDDLVLTSSYKQLHKNPDSISEYFNKSMATNTGVGHQSKVDEMKQLNEKGAYEKVIDSYEPLADKSNNSPEFFHELGKAYLEMENPENSRKNCKKAVEYLQKCLEKGGDKAMMHFSLAEAYLLAVHETGYLSIALEATEPFEKYLDKGGTTKERNAYVRDKLEAIKKYKNGTLREYQKKGIER